MDKIERETRRFGEVFGPTFSANAPGISGVGFSVWDDGAQVIMIDFFGDLSDSTKQVLSSEAIKAFSALETRFSLRIGFHPDRSDVDRSIRAFLDPDWQG